MNLDKADASSPDVLFGPFRYDPAERVLSRDGAEIPMPPRVLAVLERLLTRPGSVVSKQDLIDAAWKDTFVTDASLAEAVSTLREILEDEPQHPTFIQTVHRRGYRFVARVEAAETGALRAAAEKRPVPVIPANAEGGSGQLWVLPWALTMFSLIVAAGAIWQAIQASHTPAQPLLRVSLSLSSDQVLPRQGAALAISPDGRVVAYIATADRRRQLFVRSMDRLEATALPGTDNATAPFFSPDGQWIGFFADGQLRKISRQGGNPIFLTETRTSFGGSWGADDTIVFSFNSGLARIAGSGGKIKPVATPRPGSGELTYLWPEILPGGRAALYSVQAPGPSRIAAVSLRTGQQREVVSGGSYPRFSSTGHLIFARAGELLAMTFDSTRLETTSPPTPVLSGVATSWYDGSANFALSKTGALVYLPGANEPSLRTLRWLGADGAESSLPTPERPYTGFAISPEGRRAALTISDDRGSEVWLAELERGALTRVTQEGSSLDPVFTPSGNHIVFASGRSGPFNLFWTNLDEGALERLVSSPNNQFPSSWSPDGRALAYTEIDAMTRADIRMLIDRKESEPFIRTPWDEAEAVFSPDGRWVAYQSNQSGRWEIYVTSYPGPGRRVSISSDGGTSAIWAPEGNRLYYRADEAVMAVNVLEGIDNPQVTSPITIVTTAAAGPIRVANGRFLTLGDAIMRPSSRQFNVVLGWFDELDRLVPAPWPRVIR